MDLRIARHALLTSLFLAAGRASAAEENDRRLAPFNVPRASYFHASLEVPPMLPANQLDAGDVELRFATFHTRSDVDREDGSESIDFDGLYHDWVSLETTWGVTDRIELIGRLAFSGWDETLDRLEVIDSSGNSLVRDEIETILGTGKTARGVSVSDVTVYARYQVLGDRADQRDLSVALGLKLPLGQPQDLNSAGTIDVVLAGYFGMPMLGGRATVSTGVVIPTTDQNLFVRSADIDLNAFGHFAFALVWPLGETWSAGAQLEMNSSAFGEIRTLDGPPVTAGVGVRKAFGNWGFEVGAGTGFDWDTSYQWQGSIALTYRFD